MTFSKKHISNIIKANNDNRLAIFIGAGISKTSETNSFKLPNWNDVIEDFKEDLAIEQEGDHLKIAQLYYLEFKEFTYYEKLKQYFPDSIKPSIVHQLIFELNPQFIITTNWDTILENAIEENAYIYDVICSDKDLVKSTLQKKLIKMHGDFKYHNIVFKEDDYLNYQQNFPLIENFIKSVLSTHTVLFLGYSYNDINLKQIKKWIQHHSQSCPPMYLTTSRDNPTQRKYLENHGITSILLEDTSKSIPNLDGDSLKVGTFLKKLSSSQECIIGETDENIINFVYDKLKILDDLEGILHRQISKLLTNCGYIYTDDNLVLLKFYFDERTTKSNESTREIYKKFVNILKEYDKKETPTQNTKIEKIFQTFQRADINGIVLSKTENRYNYLKFNGENTIQKDELDKGIFFNFDTEEIPIKTNDIYGIKEAAVKNYLIKKHVNSYRLLEECIKQCLRQRNYTQLLIIMFNQNIIIQNQKFYDIFSPSKDFFENIDEYDIDQKYYNFPRDLQEALSPVYSFLNFNDLYKYLFQAIKDLEAKTASKKTIENGGIVFSSNITKSYSKHKNLILFVLKNKILIEDYSEYQTINEYFLKISLIGQCQREHTCLSRFELYSCIKLLALKNLKTLMENYYLNNSTQKGTLKYSEEDINWLIETVLPKLMRFSLTDTNLFKSFENYLINTIFLLSLIKLSKPQIDSIMNIFLRMVSETKHSFNIYESMNSFIGIEYNLFKTNVDNKTLILIIEALIHKICDNLHADLGYEEILLRKTYNLYRIAEQSNTIFDNETLIKKLILKLDTFSEQQQTNISRSFLINIHTISNSIIKEEIKNFMCNINLSKINTNNGGVLLFKLLLIINEFKKHNTEILKEIDTYLQQFDNTNCFSRELYAFEDSITYLVTKMNYNEFKSSLEKINVIITNHDSQKIFSSF